MPVELIETKWTSVSCHVLVWISYLIGNLHLLFVFFPPLNDWKPSPNLFTSFPFASVAYPSISFYIMGNPSIRLNALQFCRLSINKMDFLPFIDFCSSHLKCTVQVCRANEWNGVSTKRHWNVSKWDGCTRPKPRQTLQSYLHARSTSVSSPTHEPFVTPVT